jgi:hypothetical protein
MGFFLGDLWQLCVQGIEEGCRQDMPATKFGTRVLDEESGCHCDLRCTASAVKGLNCHAVAH